ncbi:MAG: diguanylate cyclase [Lysobacteraceae bacterium]
MAKMLATGAAVALCCWISLTFTRGPNGFPALWIASGLLIGILLTAERALWVGYVFAALLGNIAVRLAVGDSLYLALGLAIAGTLEAVVVTLAVAHYVGDATDPAKLGYAGRISTGSTLVACSASAVIAAFVASGSRGTSFGLAWADWFASHALGIVIFATLTMVTRALGWRLFGRPGHRAELAGMSILTAVVSFAVFAQSRYPLLYLIYPPLLLIAFRHQLVGVVAGSAVVATIAIGETLAGNGPFYLIPGASDMERIWLLQIFIAVTCLLTLPVATALTERRVLARNLREKQRQLLAITDNVPAFVAHVDSNQRYTFVNAYMGKVMGVEPAELMGRSMLDVLGAESYNEIRTQVDTVLSGQPVTFQLERQIQSLDYHFQATYVPDINPNGRVNGFNILLFDISQLKRAEQELVLLARNDSLTGLANRRHFDERLDQALARQRRNSSPLALLYLDIDHFKDINDRLGHPAGDEVLTEFAHRLKSSLRETDFIARLGGDEFVILLEHVETSVVAELVARKLMAAMQREFTVEGDALAISISIGIAFCGHHCLARDELIQIADGALYQAKEAGRNTYRLALADGAARPMEQTDTALT